MACFIFVVIFKYALELGVFSVNKSFVVVNSATLASKMTFVAVN